MWQAWEKSKLSAEKYFAFLHRDWNKADSLTAPFSIHPEVKAAKRPIFKLHDLFSIQ